MRSANLDNHKRSVNLNSSRTKTTKQNKLVPFIYNRSIIILNRVGSTFGYRNEINNKNLKKLTENSRDMSYLVSSRKHENTRKCEL